MIKCQDLFGWGKNELIVLHTQIDHFRNIDANNYSLYQAKEWILNESTIRCNPMVPSSHAIVTGAIAREGGFFMNHFSLNEIVCFNAGLCFWLFCDWVTEEDVSDVQIKLSLNKKRKKCFQ